MKLIVNPHKILLDKEELVNEKEINVSYCTFEFSEEITNEFVKEAYFTYKGNSYKKIIVNNQCTFPQEVLAEKGTVEIGVVAYLVEENTEIVRYNPSPVYFNTELGSLRDAENSEEPTPSEMEQYEQALQEGLSQVANVDIDATKVEDTATITITNRLGQQKSVQVKDGADGEKGDPFTYDDFTPEQLEALTGPAGTNGRDGAIQYTAGENITIDENNVISAVGGDLTNYYTKNETDTKFQTQLQYSTMPTPSADYVDTPLQYVGETDSNFTNSHWYKCNSISYRILDKITSNGGIYVGTGIIPTNHKIELSFNWPGYVNDNHVIGTSGTPTDPAWFIHFTSFANKYYWGLNGVERNGGSFTTGDHLVIFNDGEDNKLLLDGVQLDTGLSASTTELTLFRRSGSANFVGSFYYLKVWDKTNDTLIMDLVPALDENDKIVFLNKVDNSILNPSGTTLVAGQTTGETISTYWWDIVDDYYTKTETNTLLNGSIITLPLKITGQFGSTKNFTSTADKQILIDMMNKFKDLSAYGIIVQHGSLCNLMLPQQDISTSSSSQKTYYFYGCSTRFTSVYQYESTLTITGRWINGQFNMDNSSGSYSEATNRVVLERTSSTITSTYTFNALPQSSVTPTDNNHLANKKYVDDSIASAITDALGGSY